LTAALDRTSRSLSVELASLSRISLTKSC